MKNDKVLEANFDCLVGPTHHFGGLSFGNLASQKNKSIRSNPKKAALQGLHKMKYLSDRGFVQGLLPPHPRPHLVSLRNLGFRGPAEAILKEAYAHMPEAFFASLSSSAMWAANAATVSPASDTLDGKTHLSPANLTTMFHRSIEAAFTQSILKAIFFDERFFVVHEPLLPHDLFSDEGAANHSRLVKEHGSLGLELFVYGREGGRSSQSSKIYPARQSHLASKSLALRHNLKPASFLSIRQSDRAIDSGAFHNDVVAVANENLMLCHELAFENQSAVLALITERYHDINGLSPLIIEISNKELPIEDAVSSYLFNSQLLTKPCGKMLLFAPLEAKNNSNAEQAIERLMAGKNPIDEIAFFDVSESMANGGGPACLRLRVLLTPLELKAIKPTVIFSDEIFNALASIIETHYVDDLRLEHFFDRSFLLEAQTALNKIAQVLDLGSLYDAYQY